MYSLENNRNSINNNLNMQTSTRLRTSNFSLLIQTLFTTIFIYLSSIPCVSCQHQLTSKCDDQKQPAPIYNSLPQFVEQPLTYIQFCKQHQRNYESGSQEYQLHCLTYYKNLQKITKDALTVSWNIGSNNFTDWTQQQQQAFTNNLREIPESDQHQTSTQDINLSQKKVGAPVSLNWVTLGKVSKVKNQGQCGSCWSFATCAYGESRILIRNNTEIDLSEQYLLSCTENSTCDGGYLQYVFNTAADGVPLQSQYRYTGSVLTSPFICFARNKVGIGYYPKRIYGATDEKLIELLQIEPLAITISAEGWLDYKGGVFSCQIGSKTTHAVLLVGYTAEYWIIKNQWGQSWGEQGFMRITRKPLQNCNIGKGVYYMFEVFPHWPYSLVLGLILIMIGK